MSAEVAEESDPSTTVFPTGRTCVYGAECRSASGSGFSDSTFLLCFIQSSGLCTVSSTGNLCSRQAERFVASVFHVLSHMPKSLTDTFRLSLYPVVELSQSFQGGLMASAEREPIMGVWGQCPQRGPGAEPLVRGAKPP